MSNQPNKPDQLHVESARLDDYLDGARMRRLRGQELAQVVHRIFGPEIPENPLDDQAHPQRVFVMWRIVRATAHIKGLCAEDESLDSATEIAPDPWTEPFKGPTAPSQAASIRRARASRLLMLHHEGQGLPLLPPRQDPAALERWCSAASILALDLGIETTEDGRLGLEGLILPKNCAYCDVSADHVLALEELLIDECQSVMRQAGEVRATQHFRDRYGLTRREAVNLVRLTRADVLRTFSSNQEEERALMVMELKEQIGRAKAALDLDAEMKARKLLAMIQGLTRSQPEDQAREFFDAVRRVAEVSDAKFHVIAPTPKALAYIEQPAAKCEEPKVVPIEAQIEDPDDEGALAEYDQENEHFRQ